MNVEPVSEEENSNAASVALVRASGPESTLVCGRVVSTRQVREADVVSVLPAESVPRTRIVCAPSASGPTGNGVGQSSIQAAPSTEHSYVSASPLYGNDAVFEGVTPVGPPVMFVTGNVVSIDQVRDSSVRSTLPAASFARTSSVCEPSARSGNSSSDAQGDQSPVSSLHSKPAPVSPVENSNVASAVVATLPSVGPSSIVVSGGTVSTVQWRVAGDASVLPAASVALTSSE